MTSRPDDIYQFWFQGINDQTPIKNSQDPFRMWFVKNKKMDQDIKGKFEDDLLNAFEGLYKNWEETPRGVISQILLLDQFSRNMYRGSERMFAFDEYALDLSLKVIDDKKDHEYMLIERVFVYLPLQHSENLDMQQLSLEKFQALIDESAKINAANTPYYKYTFDYAKRHHDIIKRFGRFPHRNALLQRASSQEEADFLKEPGSGF